MYTVTATEILFEHGIDIMSMDDTFNSQLLAAMERYAEQKREEQKSVCIACNGTGTLSNDEGGGSCNCGEEQKPEALSAKDKEFAERVWSMLSDEERERLDKKYSIQEQLQPQQEAVDLLKELFEQYELSVSSSLIDYGLEFDEHSKNLPTYQKVKKFLSEADKGEPK